MHPRGSPLWGVVMGAVGLTFVFVAAFFGFVVTRGGQLEPGTPGTEPELVDQDAAPPSDAGTINAALSTDAASPADAGAPESEPADASPADAAPPEPAASAPPSKKNPSAKGKYKPPPRWRPRHR